MSQPRPCVGRYERRKEDESDPFSDRIIYVRVTKPTKKNCNVKINEGSGSVVCFDVDGRPCDLTSLPAQSRQMIAQRRKTPRQVPDLADMV